MKPARLKSVAGFSYVLQGKMTEMAVLDEPEDIFSIFHDGEYKHDGD